MISKYTEIIDDFYDGFDFWKNEMKMSKCESLAIVIDESQRIINKGIFQRTCIYLAYGEIAITLEKISINAKRSIIKNLTEINLEDVKKELTQEEFEDFENRRRKILEKIDAIEVKNIARVCWYYNEFNEAINEFLNVELKKQQTIEKLVELTLSRFKRDCKNTNSEKSIVYITLIEHILEEYGLKVDKTVISGLVQFIKEFKVENIYNEQLNENEIQILLSRVNRLKEKLF
ncbi:MAG: Imm3 family immunity protein [Oscillospiraceae bacterium]|nr:Imm3 family immunity protein [Oscillospiraceae bacterium]